MTLRSAKVVAQLLVDAGYTQAAIAQRADVAQATISRILTGVHKDVRGEALLRLNQFADEVAPPEKS